MLTTRTIRAAVLAVLSFGLLLSGCASGDDVEPRKATSATPEPSDPVTQPAPATVTEAEPTPSDADQPVLPFDLEALARGDFATAAGTWITSDGQTLTFSGNDLEWMARGSLFARLDGLTMAGDSAALGGHATAAGQPATPMVTAGSVTLQWSFEEGGFAQGSALVFVSAKSADPGHLVAELPADTDRDRIVALPGNGVGRLLPTDFRPSIAVGSVSDGAGTEQSADSSGGSSGPSEHAHPFAGGPLPKSSREITAVHSPSGDTGGTGLLVTPSGNIGCDVRVDPGQGSSLSCLVKSWRDAPPVSPTERAPDSDGYPFVGFGDGSKPPIFGGDKHDGFCFMKDYCAAGLGGQVVGYGEIVHYGDFVCASEETGLTCWNWKTGHGAFMSRDQFEPF